MWKIVALCVLFSGGLVASPSVAQRTPARSQFLEALRGVAATQQQSLPCTDGEAGDAVPVGTALEMLGSQIVLPRRSGAPRRGALVLAASGKADVNGESAWRLFLVVLRHTNDVWARDGVREVPLGEATFVYEDRSVHIARTEDVDDDGEEELLVVLSSSTEVQCGTGYCTRRRTLLFDLEDASPALVANVPTALHCQAEVMDMVRASTVFQDQNGDGHRDLVLRRRHCPGSTDMDEAGEFVMPPCQRRPDTVRLWVPGTDRYTLVP